MNFQTVTYLNLTGISCENQSECGEIYFYHDLQGNWKLSNGDLSYEIESECVGLHDDLAKAIFGDYDIFYEYLRTIPDFMLTVVSMAGLNSECKLSKEEFGTFISASSGNEIINKFLYLFDCRKLISGIQECNKEVIHLQGLFYKSLNLDELFYSPIEEPDGIRWITSSVTTNIYAMLGFIFIRMYSLMDYLTKLAYEIENLRKEFLIYPKLSSKNILYGDRTRIHINGTLDTIFESSLLITEIETYRNIIIHDGFLDDMPKVYKINRDGKTIEKFLFLPDRGKEGRLETFRNRNLFYNRDDKINLRLPDMISGYLI